MLRNRHEIEARLKVLMKLAEPSLKGRSFNVFYQGQAHLSGHRWEVRKNGLRVAVTFWDEITLPDFDMTLAKAAKATKDLSHGIAKSTAIVSTR